MGGARKQHPAMVQHTLAQRIVNGWSGRAIDVAGALLDEINACGYSLVKTGALRSGVQSATRGWQQDECGAKRYLVVASELDALVDELDPEVQS